MAAGVMELERLIVRLMADGSQINSTLSDTEQRIQKWAGNLTRVGMGLTAAITAPIAGALGFASKQAISFESEMANVRKVLNLSKEDTRAMGQEILTMTRTLPVAGAGLAQIAAAGGQLGVQRGQIKEFTELTAQMAVAFDVAADKAGNDIARLKNVFSINNFKELRFVGDMINEVSNTTSARAPDIIEAMTRIGGATRTFGLSTKEAVALSGAIISLGRAPEVAATAINAILPSLSTATAGTARFKQGLERIGFSAEEMQAMVQKNAIGSIHAFLNALKQMDRESRGVAIKQMFGTGADFAVISSMAEDSATLAKNLETLANNGKISGSMLREFENRADTTANKLILLKNAVQEIAINIGDVLLPEINKVVASIRPLLLHTVEWIRGNSGLVKTLIGLAGILATVGPILLTVGVTMRMFTFFVGTFQALGAVAARATSALQADAMALQLWARSAGTAQVAGVALKAALLGVAVVAGAAFIGWVIRALSETAKLNKELERSTELLAKQQALMDRASSKAMERIAGITDPGQKRAAIEQEIAKQQQMVDGLAQSLDFAKRQAEQIRDNLRMTPGKGSTALTEWFTGEGKNAEKIINDARSNYEKAQAALQALRDELERVPVPKTEAQLTGPDKARAERAAAVSDLTGKVNKLTLELQRQVATFGKSEQEVALWTVQQEAAKLGVMDTIKPVEELTTKILELTKAQETQQKVDELTTSLREQAATFGMTTRQVDIWRLAQAGAGAEALRAAKAIDEHLTKLEKQKELLEKGKQITEENRTPQEKFIEQQKLLNSLLKAGAISLSTYHRAMRAARGEIAKTGDELMRPNGMLVGSTKWLDSITEHMRNVFSRASQAAQEAGTKLPLSVIGSHQPFLRTQESINAITRMQRSSVNAMSKRHLAQRSTMMPGDVFVPPERPDAARDVPSLLRKIEENTRKELRSTNQAKPPLPANLGFPGGGRRR